MSKETVELVIGKLVVEAEFREAVKADATTALAGFDLSDEERVALSEVQSAEVGEALRELDTRISKRHRYK